MASYSTNDTPKIPRLQNSKGFALWRLYVTELMRRDGVLHVLTESPPDPNSSTAEARAQWLKDDQKARPHIVLNLAEEPATLVTSLLISDASTKEVWERLRNTYQRENIQSQLNLRTKLHNLQLLENGDIQSHLTQLEEIFVDLARINDPVAESDKNGILLRSLPKSLSFIAVVVQANNMNYMDLCALLKSEDERRKSSKPTPDTPPPAQPAARMSNGSEHPSAKSQNDRRKVTCWYCGKRGHIQSECRLRLRQNPHHSFKQQRHGRGNRGRSFNQRSNNNNSRRQGIRETHFEDQLNQDHRYNQHQARGFMTRLQALSVSTAGSKPQKTWLDCGANDHFIRDREVFTTYEPVDRATVNTCAGTGTIFGKGLVRFQTSTATLSLQCKHVPDFDENVIALSKLVPDYKIIFDHDEQFRGYSLVDRKSGKLVHRSDEQDGLYPFPPPLVATKKALLSSSADLLMDWHRKLGHIGSDRMLVAMKLMDGVPSEASIDVKLPQCIACIESKSKRAPIQHPVYRSTKPLELTHTDMTGKISVPSLGGAHYFVVFLDACTAMSSVYFIINKNQLLECLKAYKALAENESNYRMYALRLDNAGEQTSREVLRFVNENGMSTEYSPPYASQSNGASERLIQELWNMARTMLLDSQLSERLWAEAISHSNWLRNRLPSKRIDMRIPYGMWYNRRPEMSALLAFGTKGYAFQYRPNSIGGKKFMPRTLFGHFVGMESEHTLYRIYVPSLQHIQVCRRNDFTILKSDTSLPSFETLTSDIARQRQLEEDMKADNDESAEDTLSQCFFTHYCHRSVAFKTKIKDYRLPRSFREACEIPSWAEAIDREYNALVDRGTWTYIDQTPDMDPLPFTWNFRVKDVSVGNGLLCKARCCLCGNLQQAFRDFDPENLYAPVVRHETIGMFLAKVVAQQLQVEGADGDNSYLYGDMDKPIIMKQPTDSSGKPRYPGKVCLVKKSLYGARQAGEIWGSHIHKKLLAWDFRQSSQDQRLYFFTRGQHFLILIIVVDDMAFASDNQRLIDDFKDQLTATFKVKLLGKLSSFIGWQLQHTSEGIYVSQTKFADKMLSDHNLTHVRSVSTPLSLGADVSSRQPCEALLSTAEHHRYRSIIGSLAYLAVCTRPDISFAVSVLSRQLHAPTLRHLSLAKRVVRYIAETREQSIFFSSSSSAPLTAFVDSDWAGCHESRRSTTGIIVTVNGAPIFWQSKRQTLIALSSAEAEYIAASQCGKQVVWLRRLFWELIKHQPIADEPVLPPTDILSDSTGAISLTTKPSISKRNKHIDLKCHQLKDLYNRKIVAFKHIRTFDQPADMLTKPVSFPVLSRLMRLVHM